MLPKVNKILITYFTFALKRRLIAQQKGAQQLTRAVFLLNHTEGVAFLHNA